ncbi:hypothetical protein TG4357_03689 [Thalassovita gelatinovora]|uniref:Uncharacterized protein n=1 Tax=Thalassovita gelatinovora TaxID=53501 RepID=A0A0P1FKK7_THAGE|nr:hypothetical protein TG4357_03689 [Thalassovita gelatinovora]SEQ55294.1 hypothetical protein SAMN04488043_106150 [Thalassovita gelatinovora]
MNTFHNGYRGLSLVLLLNWDRILVLSAIAIALTATAFLTSYR